MNSILLNPGPVTLSQRVRDAMNGQDICHREEEFAELTCSILRKLKRVYDADGYSPVLLTGSGTSAVEAMLDSFAPREGKTVILANGVYGERMADMLWARKRPCVLIRSDWKSPPDTGALAGLLDLNPPMTHVVLVHHETTTGRLNRIEPIAKFCKDVGLELMLDTVSSFGAEKIEFGDWKPFAIAATANKCLHGIPGTAFVMARNDAFLYPSQAESVYLNLYPYHQQQKNGFSPFTQSVYSMYALNAALDELEETGGQRKRRERYLHLRDTIRSELEMMNVEPLLDEADNSCSLTSYLLPEGVSYTELHDSLKEDGFVIYAGQGNLQEKIFRIANMGDIQNADLERLILSLKKILERR